jgi:alpha-glucosidase
LRRSYAPLVAGDYHPIAAQGDLLIYRREAAGKAVIVALNLGSEPIAVTTSAIRFGSEILISTFLDREGERLEGVLDLRGNEGVVVAPPS